jgi:hypothetical protein
MSNSTNPAFVFCEKLDKDFLFSMYEDDLSYAKEVFESFLETTKEEFILLKECFNKKDLQEIRHKLHKIKPTFSFVGLPALTEKTESMIVKCDKATAISEIETDCKKLFNEIEESFVIIEKETIRIKNNLS